MASEERGAFAVRAWLAGDLECLGLVRQNERGGDAGESVVDRAAPVAPAVGRTVGLTLGTAGVGGNDSRQLGQRSTQTVPSYTECDGGRASGVGLESPLLYQLSYRFERAKPRPGTRLRQAALRPTESRTL